MRGSELELRINVLFQPKIQSIDEGMMGCLKGSFYSMVEYCPGDKCPRGNCLGKLVHGEVRGRDVEIVWVGIARGELSKLPRNLDVDKN